MDSPLRSDVRSNSELSSPLSDFVLEALGGLGLLKSKEFFKLISVWHNTMYKSWSMGEALPRSRRVTLTVRETPLFLQVVCHFELILSVWADALNKKVLRIPTWNNGGYASSVYSIIWAFSLVPSRSNKREIMFSQPEPNKHIYFVF